MRAPDPLQQVIKQEHLIWNKERIAWKWEHASQNAQVIRYDKKEKKLQ